MDLRYENLWIDSLYLGIASANASRVTTSLSLNIAFYFSYVRIGHVSNLKPIQNIACHGSNR